MLQLFTKSFGKRFPLLPVAWYWLRLQYYIIPRQKKKTNVRAMPPKGLGGALKMNEQFQYTIQVRFQQWLHTESQVPPRNRIAIFKTPEKILRICRFCLVKQKSFVVTKTDLLLKWKTDDDSLHEGRGLWIIRFVFNTVLTAGLVQIFPKVFLNHLMRLWITCCRILKFFALFNYLG